MRRGVAVLRFGNLLRAHCRLGGLGPWIVVKALVILGIVGLRQGLWLSCAAAVLLGLQALQARESEGARANSVLLNGPWECVLGDGSEGAETRDEQAKQYWQPVTLPGPFMRRNHELAIPTECVWVRRSFSVSSTQAKSLRNGASPSFWLRARPACRLPVGRQARASSP